jgi:mannose-6-phosphate isomerase-like protein (cupin superfamily)
MDMDILYTIKLPECHNGEFRDPIDDFDLSSVIENLKTDLPPEEGELITKILLKSPELSILLVKMHVGTEFISFQKNQSVTFRILQGKLKLHIRKGSLTLNEGESLILSEKTKYRIASMESTALLLTLAS